MAAQKTEESINKEELISFLSQYVSEGRKEKMEEVLQYRTRFLTLVLEDIYQPHNASAVLRSCDCLGVQDVHIIENRNTYEVNPDVVLGSEKWLTLKKYNREERNTIPCLSDLKARGYTLVSTTPSGGINLSDFKPEKPVAILFGTELHGLSEEAMQMADVALNIPMYGFTQSFNISVSAALVMYDLMQKIRAGSGWELSPDEKNEIMLEWLRRSVKKSHLLERAYRKRRSSD